MFQTNLRCYLWDLVDEGIDEVLDRIKGEAGVTGISVATCHPSVEQLRPHAGISPRTFRSPGGAQFQPQPDSYAGTRVRPVMAAWLRKGNPLATLAQACEKRGLTLRGWTVCCHNPVLAARHGNAAVKNVFGDVSPDWLCPVNPDVREYVRALVEDLAEHYPFDTIELDRLSFPIRVDEQATERAGLDLGRAGQWLSRLCFCESCRQVAAREGVNVAAAARSASVTLERVFASGEPITTSVADLVADDPLLAAYGAWRCAQVTSLVQSVRQSCRCRVVVHRHGCRFAAGADYKAISPHCDALLAVCSGVDGEDIESVVHGTLQDTGDINRVELGLSACSPACPDSPSLVRAVLQAANLGVRSVSIDNYGSLPLRRLEWIKQASRYAGREAR